MANISRPRDVSSMNSNNEEWKVQVGREIQANFEYSMCHLEVWWRQNKCKVKITSK